MAATALIIGASQKEALAALRAHASANPVNAAGLAERLTDPAEKIRHMERMTLQSVAIPLDFVVTYSIEIGHPGGTARHVSISVSRPGRAPTPEAVWMICQELGFTGSLEQCAIWLEELQRGPNGRMHKAVNVVQFVTAPVSESRQ